MAFFKSARATAAPQPNFGAFVLSLDFELHWGVRDHQPSHGKYRQNLLGAREAIPRLLDLFRRYDIAGTWATVGFLFARSRNELQRFQPRLRPGYEDSRLNPYIETTGRGEDDDPLHYASSLLDRIGKCPKQEIATHTFSHYFCLEPGQTVKTFASDLSSAIAIAGERDIQIRSLVFPRNQVNREYAQVLIDSGIRCYRGCQSGWMHRALPRAQTTKWLRLARLLDSYAGFSGYGITNWEDVVEPGGLSNVRAGQFLRPFRSTWKSMEAVRLRHITKGIEKAAKNHGIYHLWFHPHNFGVDLEENLTAFEAILKTVTSCRKRFGMLSLTMSDVARIASPDRPLAEKDAPNPVMSLAQANRS